MRHIELSEARHNAIHELTRSMRLKAAEKQALGYPDDWREDDFGMLDLRLLKECIELKEELDKIIRGGVDFEAARRECADVGFCVAMIHDKINSLEGKHEE